MSKEITPSPEVADSLLPGDLCSVDGQEQIMFLVGGTYTTNEFDGSGEPLPADKHLAIGTVVHPAEASDLVFEEMFGAKRIILEPQLTGYDRPLKVSAGSHAAFFTSQLSKELSLPDDIAAEILPGLEQAMGYEEEYPDWDTRRRYRAVAEEAGAAALSYLKGILEPASRHEHEAVAGEAEQEYEFEEEPQEPAELHQDAAYPEVLVPKVEQGQVCIARSPWGEDILVLVRNPNRTKSHYLNLETGEKVEVDEPPAATISEVYPIVPAGASDYVARDKFGAERYILEPGQTGFKLPVKIVKSLAGSVFNLQLRPLFKIREEQFGDYSVSKAESFAAPGEFERVTRQFNRAQGPHFYYAVDGERVPTELFDLNWQTDLAEELLTDQGIEKP